MISFHFYLNMMMPIGFFQAAYYLGMEHLTRFTAQEISLRTTNLAVFSLSNAASVSVRVLSACVYVCVLMCVC